MFIYLIDVGETNGPFCYVPGSHPFGRNASLVPQSQKKSRVLNSEMIVTVPSGAWRVCTGPARTLIMADTVGYHRGGKPSQGERIIVTFTYTSGVPMTDRRLLVRGAPSWPMTALQRAALSQAISS